MDKTIGVLGGGQLGRMLVEAANRLNIKVNFLDQANSPAKQISYHDGHIDDSFKDASAIRKLAATSDILTIEVEHVNTEVLEELASTVDVQPSWKTIRTIQDKFLQKEHLQNYGLPTAQSLALPEPEVSHLEQAGKTLGLPFMLKSRKEAYDGKGNFPVKSKEDFKPALEALGANQNLYAEKWADFKMELAVMVVKTKDDVLTFPVVETVHENSICKLTYYPARGITLDIANRAETLAREAVASFWGKGVFGVEMFLLPDDSLVINEIAPRPHNSGHYTIEACPVSQFEAHLCAILDLPLQQVDLVPREPAIMLNILGGDTPDSHEKVVQEAQKQRRRKVHLYGKGQARKGRKMGHITVCAPTFEEAESLMQPMIDFVDGKRDETIASPSSQHMQRPVVAVLMGSDSDLPVLQPGLAILEKLSVPFTTRITSAHRTPRWMEEYACNAASNGIKCMIAAAGGAAHLPGMVAAFTTLPVIGIPVRPSIGDGLDSFLSICNMPKGVPVATVSVDNSINAALLAARMVGAWDSAVRVRVESYIRDSEAEVREKDRRLVDLGPGEYARRYLVKK